MKKRSTDSQVSQMAILKSLQEGTVSVPLLLLKAYPKLKLSDMEAMLLIHLLAFVDRERNDFPTIEDIQNRMAASPDLVIRGLHKLLHDGWIAIDEQVDATSGIQSERYNLTGMLGKLALFWSAELELDGVGNRSRDRDSASDLYSLFESEMGRPLTPMEFETIVGWIDQDKHSEALIEAALKEAVFAGKIHFRYVDRILLEWQRNRIQSVEQAKEYTQKFRGAR